MFLRAIATQSIGCDLELFCGKPKAHEPKNPQYYADGLSANILNSAYINSLAIITEPVAKVYSFDIKLTEFFATSSAGYEQGK